MSTIRPQDPIHENVTEIFVTRVSPEKAQAYKAWALKIQQIEATFPGYKGVYIQAPEKGKGGNWITIIRFDNQKNLDFWLDSKERKKILEESAPIVEEFQSHTVAGPFSSWFAGITKAAGEVPPVWKQTMLVLLVLFPIVMLELKFLVPLLANLNPSVSTFIGNAISVTLVSWPMMPIVIYLLNWWLTPGANYRLLKTMGGTALVIGLYAAEIAVFL